MLANSTIPWASPTGIFGWPPPAKLWLGRQHSVLHGFIHIDLSFYPWEYFIKKMEEVAEHKAVWNCEE